MNNHLLLSLAQLALIAALIITVIRIGREGGRMNLINLNLGVWLSRDEINFILRNQKERCIACGHLSILHNPETDECLIDNCACNAAIQLAARRDKTQNE